MQLKISDSNTQEGIAFKITYCRTKGSSKLTFIFKKNTLRKRAVPLKKEKQKNFCRPKKSV